MFSREFDVLNRTDQRHWRDRGGSASNNVHRYLERGE